MQTEVTLKYRANNRCHRADQAEHGTPEHMHTNTHSSDHETLGTPPRRAPRVPWVSSLLLACSAPPACAVRAALAPSRRRNRTPCAQPRALPPSSRPPPSRPGWPPLLPNCSPRMPGWPPERIVYLRGGEGDPNSRPTAARWPAAVQRARKERATGRRAARSSAACGCRRAVSKRGSRSV